MADNSELTLRVLLYLSCGVIFIAFLGLMVVVINRSIQSRVRFANYLKNMNQNEQMQFAKKSLRFVSVMWAGLAIGGLGLLISFTFKQEHLVQYICYSLFMYVFVMVLISLFVYRVPKGK